EIRLDPDRYRRLIDRALLAALSLEAAGAAGVDVSSWAHQAALDGERRRRGQLRPEDVRSWLGERGLGEDDPTAVARRLAALRWTHEANRDAVAGELALVLRTDDSYTALAQRAARKRTALACLPPTLDGAADAEVLAWYFRERLGEEVSQALDGWAA